MSVEFASDSCHQDLFVARKLDKSRTEVSTPPKELPCRFSSALKRVPSLATYTLATLVAQDLTNPALAQQEMAFESTGLNDGMVLDTTKQSFAQTGNSEQNFPAVTPPEAVATQEFVLELRGDEEEGNSFEDWRVSASLSESVSDSSFPREEARFSTHTEPVIEQISEVPVLESNSGNQFTPPSPPSDIPVVEVSSTNLALQETSARELAALQSLSARDLQVVSTPQLGENSLPEFSQPAITVVESSNQTREFSPLHRQRGGEQPFEPQILPVPASEQEKEPYQASPGVTVINPSAYGASWRNAGIGLGLQERTRFSEQSDGVAGIGVGFGNPRQNVGLEVGVVIADLVDDTFEDGAINLKLHRRLPKDFAVAVGVQGAITWGNTDGGSSTYGVVTKRFALKDDLSKPLSEVYLSAGVGGGQFRSESDINNDVDSLGAFASLAVRIVEPISGILEWTGQDLTAGLSFVPFRKIPLVIVPAVTDITGNAGDGARFTIGVGYGFSF